MRFHCILSALLVVPSLARDVRRDLVAESSNSIFTKYAASAKMPNINAAYYPNWRVYAGQSPSTLQAQYLTHIFYAFVWPGPDGSVQSTDQYADTQIDLNGAKGCLGDLKRLKQRYPHLKTVLSIGGYGTGSDRIAAMMQDPQKLKRFLTSLQQMVQTYSFDGVDLDWEFPTAAGQPQQYLRLLQQLRQTFPASKYLVTSAMSAATWVLQNLDIVQAVKLLDMLNVMAYDFSGPWTTKAGHQAQLFSPARPYNDDAKLSCDSAIMYLAKRGVPLSKVVLGIPAYGRSFIGASKAGDSYTSVGGDSGTFEYRSLPRSGSKTYYDQFVGATYAVGGDGGFVSYDDTRSVQAKAKYARQHRLAGLFFWTGTGDSNDARSLIKASFQGLSA